MPIDFNLYTKFWSLQEIFNKPNQCYDKTAWKTFTGNANEVLEALKSYKLEEIKDEKQAKRTEKMKKLFDGLKGKFMSLFEEVEDQEME